MLWYDNMKKHDDMNFTKQQKNIFLNTHINKLAIITSLCYNITNKRFKDLTSESV